METRPTTGPWEISPTKSVDGEFLVVGGDEDDFGLIAAVTLEEDAIAIAALPMILDVLEECQGLAKIAATITGNRSDDEYVEGIAKRIDAALSKAGGA